MILGVRPTVDFAFKRVFGHERTIPILMNLIDSVLDPPPEHRLDRLELLNPFNLKETVDDKESILDVKARDQSGCQFNVEMQIVGLRSFAKRIVYYASKLHQQQLHEGHSYAKLRPTISISFLDHVMFPDLADHHLRFRLLEERHQVALGDELRVHLLELPKFTKAADELTSELDIWLYFLRHAEKMDKDALPAALTGQPLVVRAVEELHMMTQSDLERERYEARRKGQLDYNTGLEEAREDGEEKGRQEGLQVGRQEAQREGLIGTIHFCERLLNRPETPNEHWSQWSLEELSQFAEKLQDDVLHQRGDEASA
jgi:predicted transposase/invertase (TIGR01784 family)